MSSIFGPLDKKEKTAAANAVVEEAGFSFEDRADLLNDLLEDDVTTFPLLACPPEVLAGFLLMLEASVSVYMRPVCAAMRGAIDGNTGLWSSLIARDFADLGGLTKHYKGLRTLADARDNSRAFVRLEWDPVMICAPPPLRYALLVTAEARRRRWDEFGHALGAGWAWFSAKVCRRMAASTFLRWASLQFDKMDVSKLIEPFDPTADQKAGGGQSLVDAGGHAAEVTDEIATVRFRCGRSDAITLSIEAATDIYETVQRWHNKEHRDMMRMHFKGSAENDNGNTDETPQTVGGGFSATPTLDAAEAALFAEDSTVSPQPSAVTEATHQRGAASHRIEEAQLKLALELSKADAEGSDGALRSENQTKPEVEPKKLETHATENPNSAKVEPASLVLRAEGSTPAMVVFVKENCLASRVDSLPDRFEASIESIVRKMSKSSMWVLLYESVTEELTFRAKLAAEALCGSNLRAMDELLSTDISLSQERMALPVWSNAASVMTSLSKLRTMACDEKLRQARCELIRQASLEYCEHEDLTRFLDSQLQPLELEIDNFRGMCDVQTRAHTPHVADVGRLMFRNFCLLDSRVFRPLCLASYALVHELHSASGSEAESDLLDLLEGLQAMLSACDVADDDLSSSKDTKETFEELLVKPITAALERYAPWDIRGHPANDGNRRGKRRRMK